MTRSVAHVLRPPVVLMMTAGFAYIGGGPAWACSCAAAKPMEYAGFAEVVFTGSTSEVTRSDEGTGTVVGPGQVTARFGVETVYKGHLPADAVVMTSGDGASCGYPFREGVRYTVFAFETRRGLGTNICSGTVAGAIDPARYGFGIGVGDDLAFTGPQGWAGPGAAAALLLIGAATYVLAARTRRSAT